IAVLPTAGASSARDHHRGLAAHLADEGDGHRPPAPRVAVQPGAPGDRSRRAGTDVTPLRRAARARSEEARTRADLRADRLVPMEEPAPVLRRRAGVRTLRPLRQL